MRYYPTDLLLAVEHVGPLLVDLVDDPELHELFDPAALAEGLDVVFGGLSQYPFRPNVDTDDVDELGPIGTVVLDDDRPANTVRGLLFAWAAGNEVVIRTDRHSFWTGLLDALTGAGVPVPAGRTVDQGMPVSGGFIVRVPDPAPGLVGAAVLAVDCRASWMQWLIRRVYRRGVPLAVARSADLAEQTGRLDAHLRYLLAQARRSPYYRDLPHVTGTAQLDQLPVLTKADLDAHSLPASRDLSSGASPSGQVLRSGATSGRPRYIVYSRADWSNMVREAIPLFYSLGLRPGDRVINTLSGGGLYGGMTTTVCELSLMPLASYTFGQHVRVEDLLMLSDSFDANAILGNPAVILPVLRELHARRPEVRFEKVIYGGTPMAETDKSWLRDHIGTRVITSILAANDGAQLGHQCAELGGTLHHLCPDYNLVEAVDDDGHPVPEGESGHLLITTVQKFEGPLIRYRIGDYGRVFQHRCACGVAGPVLEYLGRSDGLIRIRARETVLHSEIFAALQPFREAQLQIEVTARDDAELVILRTESPVALDPEQVRRHVADRFAVLRDTPDGRFALSVECLAEGRLARDDVSGKTRTVIDRRLLAA